MKINVFWFRRDLSLKDNHGLYLALKSSLPVLGLFIFDKNILVDLNKDDARVSFIYDTLIGINTKINMFNSSLIVKNSTVEQAFIEIIEQFDISEVFANEDYEPDAIQRDNSIKQLLEKKNIRFSLHKNQVIFAKDEILKNDGKPYTVFTPYKNKWLQKFQEDKLSFYPSESLLKNLIQLKYDFPLLKDIGFKKGKLILKPVNYEVIENYDKFRDFPAENYSTCIGPHLRFGTISIRTLIKTALTLNSVFLSELIWREFFMQILYHFPYVEQRSFKPVYDLLEWENDENQFAKWCVGETGYPIVDAGMKELNSTGYMHNRVRMISAGFLVKHLLIDWRWGEAYFAEKLLDYELASNNGNWQWAAGTGCDAAPYFRIFNPYTQQQKFDKDFKYIKKFIPYFDTNNYLNPIIAHKFARERCISRYKNCIDKQ
ncbi:MAG: deoxyribodipyrimidine photo-lyase [Bacteroidales bacterium]|nr:deoxyribodipyrimidine photo-lyase [Bacteroidales bacterium]MDD4215788.1 deoxyribodipyrimidine photo-lyase [Bacteroidales bacterium]MDY0142196.1 deoxyribodipyrimidine photo-lyase [Bacteroidales bacterium]